MIENVTDNLNPPPEERRIVRWTEPPPPATPRSWQSTYAHVVRELRANPGAWAQLEDRASERGAYQFVLGVRRGSPAAFRPAGSFQARHQGPSVWVRYVGEDVPEPESESESGAKENHPERTAPDFGAVFKV